MADQAEIDDVKENLPTWLSDIPAWTDQKISALLDKHKSTPKVVRQFWVQMVNDNSALTDVSDVGAARPLSQLYQHAKEQLEYWDKVAGSARQGTRIGKIKPRYVREGQPGLNPAGGVYERVD